MARKKDYGNRRHCDQQGISTEGICIGCNESGEKVKEVIEKPHDIEENGKQKEI